MDNLYNGLSILNSLYGAAMAATVLTLIIWVVVLLLVYAYQCYIILCIGRKTGLPEDKNWMAFVPVARWIYCLKMLNRPWWQIFFFSNVGVVCVLAISWALHAIFIRTSVVAVIVGGLYGLAVLYMTLTFMAALYQGFGFKKLIVFCGFTPVLNILIAFSERITFKERDNCEAGMLIGISGTYANQQFELKSGIPVAIGRDPDKCNIVYPDGSVNVSRLHCNISYFADAGLYGITDFSKNGTFADGVKLPPTVEKMCYPGTIISIGDESDRFRLR